MKRLFSVIPALLLLLLNACGAPAVPLATPTPTWTTMPTSPPLPTFDNVSPAVFDYLNQALEIVVNRTELDRLEHITGASYQVIHVEFPRNNGDGSLIFRIDTRCQCALNARCCSPTRTFAVSLMAIQVFESDIVSRVQLVGLVNTLQVGAYDHTHLTDIFTVPWADLQSFYRGEINGYQLAAKVGQTPFP